MTKAEPAGRCHRGGTHDWFRRRRRSETDGRRQRQRSTHLSQGHLSHGRQSTTPWRRERSAASSPSSPDRTVQIRLRHPALVIIDHNSASVPASLPLTAAQGSSETVHCKLSSFVIDEKDVRPRWPKRYTCRVLSLSDRRYSLNPLSQTRIDWVGRYRIRLTFKLSCVWH